MKQTPSDKGIEKARKYLKDNGLLAVPFDMGVGFRHKQGIARHEKKGRD